MKADPTNFSLATRQNLNGTWEIVDQVSGELVETGFRSEAVAKKVCGLGVSLVDGSLDPEPPSQTALPRKA